MAKIEIIAKWLKETESKKILAPKTLASCVYDENGETVEARLNEVFQSVSIGKSLIASAITDKGITTAADATFQTMADNIYSIQQADIFSGLTANNLTIQDYIASINGASSFFKPSKSDIFRPGEKTWEIGIKVYIEKITSYSQVFFGSDVANKFYNIPSLEIQPKTNSGKLWAGISINGTTWDLAGLSEKTLNLNTWYYIRYKYDGLNYIVEVSTDSVNWETYISFAATGLSCFLSNIEFGGIAKSSYHYASNCKFDLRWRYLKIENAVVWGGSHYDTDGGCYDGFLTYGGVGVGGVATYYELEKAPNQPIS